MKSLVGNKETCSPVILDACTIINLLRIDDEEEEFLYKHLTTLNLHIAGKVYTEVRANFNKNTLSENQAKYIDICLGKIYKDATYHSDDEIVKDLSNQVFNEIKTFSANSYYKDNGELYSTALGLVISRTENNQVLFYTDDKPATDYFMPYFKYQQIGTIMDTVDLLIYLYWSNPDFDKKRLNKYLQAIYSDINQPFKVMINDIQKIRDNFSNHEFRKKGLINAVDNLIRSYQDLDIKKMQDYTQEIKDNYNQSKVAKILSKNNELLTICPLVSKLIMVKKNFNKYEIFKIQ